MAKSYKQEGTVGTTLSISNMDRQFRYNEVGITFYTDGTYATTVPHSSLTGSVAVTGTPQANEYDQDFQGSPINVSVQASLETPLRAVDGLKSVTATPSAITGATHWRLTVVGYEA